MTLTSSTRRKEELIITDGEERSIVFNCGWGIDPPVAYMPLADQRQECVSEWLWDRRVEVIEVMRNDHHRVVDGRDPPLEEQRK